MTLQIYTTFCLQGLMHKFLINICRVKQNKVVSETNLIYLLIPKLENNVLVGIYRNKIQLYPCLHRALSIADHSVVPESIIAHASAER